MRILQQCIYFPPEVGGLESHAYYLCKELVRLGNEVEMLTSRSRPGLPAHEIIDGIEVTRSWFPARNPIGWTLHTLASTPKYQIGRASCRERVEVSEVTVVVENKVIEYTINNRGKTTVMITLDEVSNE